MFLEERKEKILEILRQKKSATVNELAESLYASPVTIRRDLSALEHDGVAKRSHGGAVLVQSISLEASLSVRELERRKEKRQIAELAATLIQPHSTLFIDSSSTVGALIPLLSSIQALSVITNGIKNALLLSEYTDAKVLVCGGTLNANSNSLTGIDTCQYVNRLNADLAILSCSGVDGAGWVTEVSTEQSRIKEAMLGNARRRLLLCDSSKLGVTAMSRTCPLSHFHHLLTNCPPPGDIAALAAGCGCTVAYPAK